MTTNIKEGSLIITEDRLKGKVLKLLRDADKLFDFKIMGLTEFKKKYYFDYGKEAVYHVHKKYGVIKEVAQVYLNNLYYIDDIPDKKLAFLKDIKDDLKENGLLLKNKEFRNYLNGKNLVLYDLKYVDKFYDKMFDEISRFATIERVEGLHGEATKKEIYKFTDKSSEVAFVASRVAELLKNGILIDRIKLVNVNSDYEFELKNTFIDFNIPLDMKSNESILSTTLVKRFKESFGEDIDITLENLKSSLKTPRDAKIYKMIIDCLNDYAWAPSYMEVRDFIFSDLGKIKVPSNPKTNAVHVVSSLDEVEDEDYVFLINFNQNVIPVSYKDEDYLNDEIKNRLHISDSVDLNKKAIASIKEKIKYIKNLIVTYSEKNLDGELYISNAYDEELFIECLPSISFEHSNRYNKRILLKDKDENRKYGTTSKRLISLNNHYKDEPYLDYDNSFKGINKASFNKYLDNKLVLSYSSMNSFYKCSFRYYLESILKLDKFEDTFEIVVGNIFHRILSKILKRDYDFDELWEKTLEETEFEFKEMETFFLSILKEELKFIIDTIKEQREYTDLSEELYEQKIEIIIKETPHVIFKGFVDKILYKEIDGEKIVSIVDYKTGHPELNIDNSIYGLEMQLPIYAYLIKNYAPLKDAQVGGFYLQRILNNLKDPEKKKDSLKLQGYSNSDTKILSHVDHTYSDSKVIKSLRMSSNGFYKYCKILSTEEIDMLTSIVKDKIEEAAENILNANFAIGPKQIGDDLIGCSFCKFKDICYMKNADIKNLPKKTKKDFLGGEIDANMD